jgi:hypothetical protein
MNIEKPTIIVYLNPLCEGYLKEVKAGLEEEGIPCSISYTSEVSAEELASRAAKASLLEVGIGMGKNYICVTLSKLPEKEPLLKYRADSKSNQRLCGINAARLVKGNSLIL